MNRLKFVFGYILAASLAVAAQQSQYPAAPVVNQQQNQQAPVYNENQATSASAMTVPAGTNLSIRTNENINATKADEGKSYSAEIAQNVLDQNGRVLIPTGSPATLKVGKVSSGTMGAGSNEVALGLQSVTIGGRTYQVSTAPVRQTSTDERGIGANKRTAIMTGGGAVLGTVIGAMAGGGKGAAIGAILGAGGGAAAQVLTRGDQVKVPAETVLTFHLDQPITLQ
ncbi:MAG: hypothetical protein ACE14L_11590 [Terriglobales bacterium]